MSIFFGLLVSTVPEATVLGAAVNPVLGLLLFATFLSVPLTRLRMDLRFVGALALLNFVLVPLVVWVLTFPLRDDAVLLTAALLVLLAPCIDYVIAFTGLAGGARERLLAATPLLLLAQMVLLPLYLRLFIGPEIAGVLSAGPFLEAFLWLILLPLGGAWLVQVMESRSRIARGVSMAASSGMVVLMMATLFVVIAGHAGGVGERLPDLGLVIGVYVAFAVAMNVIGWGLSRRLGFGTEDRVALTFSAVTRNSLVILPFALALPAGYELAPIVVVTQTMVELVAMVVMVRALPALSQRKRIYLRI
ncbi:hypothetical protein A605_04000 [Corynebacterium halotolerans YIM 70093 = DSM 44683]|uniref:Arsenic resistance protein n=1 Tax=Corynebacterium halotolerans YIM 70093 = DSM 44683 TaxID=1121362 RepID=M1P565_9CORY|nr:hypothetical protein A605_04000 [Corynebacterium halotolerans YIM 70093 = DSM 44683]